MATKTWNGSNDSFSNPADWSPSGVPMAGDTAVIHAGTVSFSGTLSGVAIQLDEASGSTTSPGLSLTDATLDATASLTVANNDALDLARPTITVAGRVTFAGTESFTGTTEFQLSSGATLINSGTMTFNALGLFTSGASTLQNDGTLSLQNNGTLNINVTQVTGTGTIALGQSSAVSFDTSVGSGQTLVLSGGSHDLFFYAAGTFKAPIQGFSTSDLIEVGTNKYFGGVQYSSTGPGTGTLQLLSGPTQIGALTFAGANYQTSDFQVTSRALRGGFTDLLVRTTGPTVSAVYRFFDTRLGTHFVTADAGEKATVIATRPDLVEETNGFGDVPRTDPNAAAVYRFFDTTYGTHFVTSNAGERDTVIATRPDLVYEPNSTFYEHASQQPGDVAVYRLFSTTTGTQLLTGNQGEYAGLTTAGSSAYRADLRSEGVAFYAPGGTFT